MKSIFRKSLLVALFVLPVFFLIESAYPARAAVSCSGMAVPLMSITVNGTTYSNSSSDRDAVYAISVASGSVLSVTFNNTSPGALPYNISRTWPTGHTQTYTSNPGSQTVTTDAINASTFISTGVDRDCIEDPTVEGGGSVQVNVSVTGGGGTTTYALSAAKAGTGSGSITSSPAGINCGADCSESYTSGTTVSLTATPASGSTFAGWSGSSDCTNDAGGATANPTTVSMNAAKSCTATFNVSASAPSCSASASNPGIGQSIVITATGGSGGTSPYYSWNTGSGGGSCATGGTCTTSYSTSGTKTITVTRNGVSGTCSVTVSTAPNPPTAAYTGSSACTVSGWGDDVDTTTARPIRVYYKLGSGSAVLGPTVTAGTSGCTGSACTFSADLSSYVTPGVAYTITGEVQGDTNEWVPFTNTQTSLSLTCPVSDVTCSGPTTGVTGTTYTFSATGGSAHTWSISPTSGITPSGASGSASSVSKAFTTTGTKTITFTRTDTGVTGQCAIVISSTPAALSFALGAYATGVAYSDSSILVNYGATPILQWTSAGANSVQKQGSTPSDSLWTTGTVATAGTQAVSLATTRRVYSARGVTSSPVQVQNDDVTVRVQPECLPGGQTVAVGETATLSARGGNGSYVWTATGGTITGGSTNATLNVSYTTEGTKSITVVSDGLTSTACSVTVTSAPVQTGTVVVNSNVPTTWSLSSTVTDTVNEGANQTTETYTNMPVGTYTLGNLATLEGYQAGEITSASSQLLASGATITFTINYDEEGIPPTDEPGVDLKINDSNNPAPVATGSTVALTWSSSDITTGSCVASNGIAPWGGSVDDDGHDTSGALDAETTFTITCESNAKGGGEYSDSVTVGVTYPQCSNGIDDDGDDLIDFGEEPIEECEDALDNNEAGQNTSSGDVTECSDGFDNDGDGGIDFNTARGSNGDQQCSSLLDDSESGSPDIREI